MEQFDPCLFGNTVSGREIPPAVSGENRSESVLSALLPKSPDLLPSGIEQGSFPPIDKEEQTASDSDAVPVFQVSGPDEGGPTYDPAFAHVRFLHAVVDGEPIRLALGNRLLTSRLSAGNLTGCFAVRPGFRTLALFDAQSPASLLYLGPVPFSPGEIATLAIVRSANRGMDLVRVDDRACYMRGTQRACIRVVNLIYNSPSLDILLTDGRVVFTDVRFKETTSCRRARAGRYDMYAARTPCVLPSSCSDIETIEELPAIAASCLLPGFGTVEPIASFDVNARAGATETAYLMGNWSLSHHIRVRVVENC